MRPALACQAVWVLALAGGCSRDASDVIEQADRSVASWSSCVRLAARQWAARRIPDVYLRQVLEAADEALDEQTSSLSDVPPTDPRRQGLERRIGEVRDVVHQLNGALARSDRDAAAASARRASGRPRDDDGGGAG
jgi:hypothetical protein